MPVPKSVTESMHNGSLSRYSGGQVHDSEFDHTASTKLIVTFFPKSRLAKKGEQELLDVGSRKVNADVTFPSSYLDAFASLLNQLAPDCQHQTTQHLTPQVTQSIYVTSNEKLPDFSSSRNYNPLRGFEMTHALEIIFDIVPNAMRHAQRPLKLALFDMDSTLINEEVIDELARSIGISDAVSAITARAMNGDIDFATSLKERVAMLKGVPTTVWDNLKQSVTIANGARELVSTLKRKGVLTVVVSGGFIPMAEWLKGELGLDVAVANHLLEESPTADISYPHLSGLLDPTHPLITPELKRETLLSLAAAHSVPLSETLAVGDGSNDLLMLGSAGLGIAWNAKEKVQISAPMRLNGDSLADLLYLLGPESEESIA